MNEFLTAATSIKITSQDPQLEQKKTERFQGRIIDAVMLVGERIQKAINETTATR